MILRALAALVALVVLALAKYALSCEWRTDRYSLRYEYGGGQR